MLVAVDDDLLDPCYTSTIIEGLPPELQYLHKLASEIRAEQSVELLVLHEEGVMPVDRVDDV